MVEDDDLTDDGLYEELKEDVGGELQKFGTVRGLEVPRAGQGLMKIYVLFEDMLQAEAAASNLSGRIFAGRTVEVRYYSAEDFAQRTFEQ